MALLVSIVTLGLPHAPGPGHDADCDIIVVAHDSSAHQVHTDGPVDRNDPVHCLACHWARSFRPHAEAVYRPAPAAAAGVRLLVEAVVVVNTATAAQPPLRSPPFTLPTAQAMRLADLTLRLT